jgi:hypothetical protein
MRPFRTVLAAVALLAAVACAQDEPRMLTAREVVARWRDAAESRREPMPHTAKLKSVSNEDGIKGKITEWVTSDCSYRRVTKRKFDESEVVLMPGGSARRDWNGWLRKLDGRELERWRTIAYEAHTLAFGPSGKMASAEVSLSDDKKSYVLHFTPEGGSPMTWYIDTQTFLATRSVRPGWDTEVTSDYSDWRDINGVLTPRHIKVSETEKPTFDVERKDARVDKGARRFKLPKGENDTRMAKTVPPISFTMEASHIVFPVSVNGRPPLAFILDTGADQNIIATSQMANYGLEVYAKSKSTGGGNETEYDYSRDATFSLPGVTLRNQHVAVLDQDGLEKALGMRFGGILGYDFISRFVIEIDYQKKLLTLHDPATWQYTGSGAIVPVVIDEGIPFTHATLEVAGHQFPAFFVIDFGAAETMTLTSAYVKANDLAALAQTSSTVNGPAGLEKQFFAQHNTRGHIDRLELGPLAVENIPVNMSVNTGGAYASKNFSGTIGESIYKRYHVFLDYARNRLILEPTAEASQPFPERQAYGLSLLALGNDLHTFTVAAVRAGSPAEQDGFKKGDVVDALDGKPAAQFTLSELRDALATAGARHELGVTRGGEHLAVAVEVRLVSLYRR